MTTTCADLSRAALPADRSAEHLADILDEHRRRASDA